ncbi:segregation/condensation protein A [Lactiplantibacillus pentosus]|nr:segregation/condensation protein A [Lactiplantibacillus pentosus]AYJ43478.1 segregation/condensation protein A [Lactiplantibacillus pentosus]MCT3311586.1 segregation/condensation protein A [Lactiplantibacillus pentosus]PKX55110.1 segregation/condensation protein A [Lactiplantibacillus pentosus]UZO90125.1 segregation/condensation protein A [Lactiplantibacillus pentosus]WKF77528.1 segregation/condensation protein A [Lactiplantibacillus pentosus]
MVTDEQQPITIKISEFEGPLDLLLHLIRQNKMDIYDIPIAAITQQYLDYLHSMRALKLDIVGDYLVMAATLMTIKSRFLLPQPEPEDDEDLEDDTDPRDSLVAELLAYKVYQEAAGELRTKEQERHQHFTREAMLVPADLSAPKLTAGITLDDLQAAFRQLVAKRRRVRPLTKTVVAETVNIDERMVQITTQLQQQPHGMDFADLFTVSASDEMLVTTFMAVLELTKQDQVSLQQAAPLTPIHLYLRQDEQHDEH